MKSTLVPTSGTARSRCLNDIPWNFCSLWLCFTVYRLIRLQPLSKVRRGPEQLHVYIPSVASPGESSPIFPRIPVKALILLLLGLLWVCAQVSRKYKAGLKCSDPLSLGLKSSPYSDTVVEEYKMLWSVRPGLLGSLEPRGSLFLKRSSTCYHLDKRMWTLVEQKPRVLIHGRSLTILQIFVYYPSLVPWPG